jgi:hypothetical protein
MKFLFVVLVLSVGLLAVKSEDEVTEVSSSDSSIDSEKVKHHDTG